MKTARLTNRLTARGRRYRRGPSLLEEQEALWAQGLLSNPVGRVYTMKMVEDAYKADMAQYDRLPRAVRDAIKYHRGW